VPAEAPPSVDPNPAEALAAAVVKDWKVIEAAFDQAIGTAYGSVLEHLRRAKDRFKER